MLESIRKGQRWLTGLLVALVGGVFVFFMGLGQPLQGDGPAQGVVVELGDIRLAVSDFQRVRLQQAETYRDQLGDQFNSAVGRSFLDAQALRALVDRAILAHDAYELGLRVGKEEIQRLIVQTQGFRDEAGRFDAEGFKNYVEYEYGNQANYIEFMRRSLLGQKMVRLLYSQGEVSQGEARTAARHRLEQVQIAYVALDTESVPEGSEPSDEQIAAYAADHEVELNALYEDQLEDFAMPPQMRLRHMLFEVSRDSTPGELEEVQKRADAALARLAAGEEFAAVATEVTDDPSTREDGGSLGLVGANDIAKELVMAVSGLEPGEHGEVARTDRGLHIVLLEERTESGTRPFEDVRDELARTGATRVAAAEQADRVSDELAAAIRGGQSLEEAARERELAIERTGMLRRRSDGYVVGLGASGDLLAMAFALDPDSPSSPEIFKVGSKLALIQVMDRIDPEPDALADAAATEQTRLAEAKRDSFVQNWIQERRTQLSETGQLKVDSSVVSGT